MHNKAMLITVQSLMIIHYLCQCLKIRHKKKSIMIQQVSIWILCRSTTLQWKAMTESHADTCVGGESFQVQLWIQRLCKQCSSEHHHPQCCWPTIHTVNLLSKICPKPNYKFSHLFFLRSMTCSMSIEQKMCEKKISSNHHHGNIQGHDV